MRYMLGFPHCTCSTMPPLLIQCCKYVVASLPLLMCTGECIQCEEGGIPGGPHLDGHHPSPAATDWLPRLPNIGRFSQCVPLHEPGPTDSPPRAAPTDPLWQWTGKSCSVMHCEWALLSKHCRASRCMHLLQTHMMNRACILLVHHGLIETTMFVLLWCLYIRTVQESSSKNVMLEKWLFLSGLSKHVTCMETYVLGHTGLFKNVCDRTYWGMKVKFPMSKDTIVAEYSIAHFDANVNHLRDQQLSLYSFIKENSLSVQHNYDPLQHQTNTCSLLWSLQDAHWLKDFTILGFIQLWCPAIWIPSWILTSWPNRLILPLSHTSHTTCHTVQHQQEQLLCDSRPWLPSTLMNA